MADDPTQSPDAPNGLDGENKQPSIPAPAAPPRPESKPPSIPAARMQRKATLTPGDSSVPPPALNMMMGGADASPMVVPPPSGAAPFAEPMDEATHRYDLEDAPTMDYDPRARGIYMPATHQPAADSGPPPPVPTPPPPADEVMRAAGIDDISEPQTPDETPSSRRSSRGRRRSRRTVKIPDDPVVRASPGAEPQQAMLPPADVNDPVARQPGPSSRPPQPASARPLSAPPPRPPYKSVPPGEGAQFPRQGSSHDSSPPASDAQPTLQRSPSAAELAALASPAASSPSTDNHTVERPPSPAELAGLSDLDEEDEAVTIIRPMQIISIGDPNGPPMPPLTPRPEDRVPTAEAAAQAGIPPAAAAAAGVVSVEDEELISAATSLLETDIEAIEEIEPDRMSEVPAPPRKPPPPPKGKRPPTARELPKPAGQAEPPPAKTKPAAATAPPATEKKRKKPWWEELFGDDYIRTLDRLDAKHVTREVSFIEESLGVEKGGVILDLACGAGQHAVELASRGYAVVGYDLSLAMLARAADEAQERQQKLNFLQGDMREMAFEEMFDGVYCWSTSFGYFDDEKNLSVLQRIHRSLRQGGMLLLDIANRDYVAPRSPSLVWFEGDGCVCMDDMHVDFFTSRLRVRRTAMFDDGRSGELDYSIRLYTLHELGKLLHDAGFKVVEVTGHPAHLGVFFGSESPRMIVLAERI